MFKPKFLTKEEIEKLIRSPVTDDEIAECKASHLLVSVRNEFFDGPTEPGSVYFKLRDGKEVLDCTSQAWVLNLGHAPPDISYAAALQSQQFTHTWSDFLTPIRVKLCNKLAQIAPGQLKGGRVSITNRGGGAALECAIKLALVTNKWGSQIVTFWRGYHGSSLAMMGASQRLPMRFSPFGEDRWVKAVYPYCYRCPWKYKGGIYGERDKSCKLECLALVKQQVENFTTNYPVACLLEPMQGPGGQIPAPVDFLAGLKKVCQENKMLLIYDEAQTGFGRTGKMFASDWYESKYGQDISPDVMCLTKAAAAGYPLGITIAKPQARTLADYEEHTTFASPPISMAAALVNIEILQKCNIPENAAKQGAKITQFLKELQGTYPQIGDVRGPGLFIGVEFVKDPKTREPFNELLEKFTTIAWDNGIYFGNAMPIVKRSGELVRNILKIKPPLVISDEHTAKICELFEKSLKEALDQV
jgi:4-aminobutyrate aminotransferase/(S)-3-amino-2-methylpropionate transaminase